MTDTYPKPDRLTGTLPQFDRWDRTTCHSDKPLVSGILILSNSTNLQLIHTSGHSLHLKVFTPGFRFKLHKCLICQSYARLLLKVRLHFLHVTGVPMWVSRCFKNIPFFGFVWSHSLHLNTNGFTLVNWVDFWRIFFFNANFLLTIVPVSFTSPLCLRFLGCIFVEVFVSMHFCT